MTWTRDAPTTPGDYWIATDDEVYGIAVVVVNTALGSQSCVYRGKLLYTRGERFSVVASRIWKHWWWDRPIRYPRPPGKRKKNVVK